MKLITIAAAAILMGLSSVFVISAAPASGTTTILGAAAPNALAFTPTDVDVSIVGGAPIVPYEYSLENRCWFSTNKTNGPSDSYERFDLIGPWFVGGDENPHSTVTVNNNPVPATSTCKVQIMHNNTAVKGSLTQYNVVP